VYQLPVASLAALDGLIEHTTGLRLAELAGDVPADQAIVELGSYRGKSTCYLAAGARRGQGAHVWAVDAWDNPENESGRHGYAEPGVREAFMAQVGAMGLQDRITGVQAFTRDAAAAWQRSEQVGLLFVDASHVQADVQADFDAWARHLAPGAVVAFDDYGTHRNPGVAEVVDGLVTARRLVALDLSCPPLAVARVPDGL
jgi:predicted O-methyltransferase YrrM